MCPEPEVEGGMTAHVTSRSIGGVAHYSCPKGQYIEGNNTRVCSKKGRWQGRLPTCKCKYSICLWEAKENIFNIKSFIECTFADTPY